MAAGDVRAGGAYVEISSRDNTKLSAIERKLTAFARGIAKVGVSVISTEAVAAVYQAITHGSHVKDMADRTGLAYSAVQELGYAARQSGTDINALETGIKFMQRAIAGGSKELKEELGALGVDLESLAKLSPDRQLQALAATFARIPPGARQTDLAVKLFGKSGTDLIPLLKEGERGIQKLRDRARELGIVMSDEAVVDAERLGDAVQEMRDRIEGLQTKIGVALLPALENVLTALNSTIPKLNEFADAIKTTYTGAMIRWWPTKARPGVPLAGVTPEVMAEARLAGLEQEAKERAARLNASLEAIRSEVTPKMLGLAGTSDPFKIHTLGMGLDIDKAQLEELKKIEKKLPKPKIGQGGDGIKIGKG